MADETLHSVVHRSVSSRRHDRIEAPAPGSVRCSHHAFTVTSCLHNLSAGA